MPSQDYMRMLGTRDGLSHALISLRSVKNDMLGPNRCYLPPERHCRKRTRALNKVAELEKVEAIIQRQLSDVTAALQNLQ